MRITRAEINQLKKEIFASSKKESPKQAMYPDIENEFLFQIKGLGLPLPKKQYRFYPKRQWRFDFCYPDRKLAIECEGGIWIGGKHIRPAGFEADCEKYNTATLLGWRLMRFTSRQIRRGQAIEFIEKEFKKI